ncbi:50S ribosomal protein L35ae [Candidatus Pacearchaeota archaeon]|nr:50S ribosomal protein L35ae [Candidatus Pacearchaeota archaeon]
MKGTVEQFRRGRHRIHEKHFVLDLSSKNREEAKKLVGRIVSWKSPAGKEIRGKISSAHGNKGRVRAIFERGLPGQSVGTEITLIEDMKETKIKPKKEE